ncbi:MAG TPA: hypothetical protein VFU36_16185 [Jatrophihabitans sp.]|nr:hypothetical protein [Jatrophihabitans sp.]
MSGKANRTVAGLDQPSEAGSARVPNEPAGNRRLLSKLGWLLLAGVLLAGLAWLLITGLLAKRQLDAAQHDVSRLRASVDAADISDATRQAQLLAGHAHQAHRLTTGPSWWLAAQLPWLGRPAVAARGDANQLDQLSPAC